MSEHRSDSGNGTEPVAVATEPEAEAVSAPAAQAGDDVFNVFLRLSDGERVEAGSFGGEAAAHSFAEQLMTAAAAATTTSKWPRIGDRYLRPETIVSIDVERSNQPRWTGSTGRASSWSSNR